MSFSAECLARIHCIYSSRFYPTLYITVGRIGVLTVMMMMMMMMIIKIQLSKNVRLCSSVTEISEKIVPFEMSVGVKQSRGLVSSNTC
jgi:hypothetical protein